MKNIAACIALLLGTSTLADGTKSLAVLEYRAGSEAAGGIGSAFARLLQKHSSYRVQSPQDARRRWGASLDAQVAACSGQPSCIGAIGAKLGTDEVLLVGISQLGDVVLALQRVDTKQRSQISRIAELLPPATAPAESELLDWLHELFPPDAFRRYGAIHIVADVEQASVSVNGSSVGNTPLAHPLALPAPAEYRLRLEKPGFVPFQARIGLLPESTVEVRALLAARPESPAVYKRWYIWTAIGAAAAVAATSIAIYYGTRVDNTPRGFLVIQR